MTEMNNLSSASKSIPECETSTSPTDVQHTGQISISYTFNASKNRIPLIFRLPTETLESIFLHGARDHFYREENSFLLRATPRWVHVSYVCRRWRSVSLNYPMLWTYLFETSPRWTEELLSRSKQAPLKLRVDLNFWDNTHSGLPFVEQVITHVERLEEFRIRLPPTINPIHRIFSVLSLPAPCLRNLSFLPSYLSSSSEWSSSVPFGGDTPALRTLKLTRCALPWYSLKLSGLTTLDLSYIPLSHQKSIEDFLSTLRCMQDLTHLYLEDAVASANHFLRVSTATFDTVQKINLPHLSHLFISAPLSTLVAFLSYVNFPSKTEVRLGCKSDCNSTLDDHLHLSSLFTRRCQSFDCPAIRSLTIKFVRNKATLAFSASELGCDVFAPRGDWFHNVPMQLYVDFDRSMSKRDRDDIVSDICCKMPLATVRSVHVMTPRFSSSFWSAVLGHLLEIRYLKLSHGFMPDLAPALSPIPHGDMEGGRLLATALEELELCDITFSSPSDPKNFSVPPATDVDSLYDALSARKASGGKLTMSRCVVGQFYDTERLDMVGRWGEGQFLVIEERRQPNDSVFDSDSPSRAKRRRNASF